jgi:hypothetical protein
MGLLRIQEVLVSIMTSPNEATSTDRVIRAVQRSKANFIQR